MIKVTFSTGKRTLCAMCNKPILKNSIQLCVIGYRYSKRIHIVCITNEADKFYSKRIKKYIKVSK